MFDEQNLYLITGKFKAENLTSRIRRKSIESQLLYSIYILIVWFRSKKEIRFTFYILY
jgi:hypothetical protein